MTLESAAHIATIVGVVIAALGACVKRSVEGYSFLSLILASSVVNRQWTVARC